MRFAVTAALWLATTVALGVAIPAAWAQLHVVDTDGYAALARRAAGDPAVQAAMADELTNRTMALVAAHGGGRYPVDSAQVHQAASAFTAGPGFPPLFAQANLAAHGWLFTDPRSDPNGGQWAVDVAPMLRDSAIQTLLVRYNVQVPTHLTVPLAESMPRSLRQGQLSPLSTWGPWVSLGAAAVSGFCALLTLAFAGRRGKALSSLGVCALLVGAAGWAGIEVAGRHVDDALNRTTSDRHEIADVMVRQAEVSMHQWLDVTLIAGAGLVALGVLVAIVGGLSKGPPSRR